MARKDKQQLKKRSHKVGLPPGSLPEKAPSAERARASLIQYNQSAINEEPYDLKNPILPVNDKIEWINVDGVHDTETLKALGQTFNIHSLILEDISSLDQRPKVDEYGDQLFATIRMMYFDEESGQVDSEQVSLVLGKHYLLSFQEKEGDVFDKNRERLRSGKGRIRSSGADYLFYTLLDTVVDHYYVILESLGEKIDELEIKLIENPQEDDLRKLYRYRNETMYLKKWAWPTREMINKLLRNDSGLMCKDTEMYLRDVYDHSQHVIDTIESYRDLLASMMDLYLNSVSNRLNQVMKVLTVIATIFIPLTFLTGVYGMNFHFMPELDYNWAYPGLLVLMFVIIGIQLVYFKKKGWL